MKQKSSAIKFIVIALPVMVLLSGCAILGFPNLAPQSGDGYSSKVFDKDVSYCYENTLGALKKWNASVQWEQKDKYIVGEDFCGVFVGCVDTTQVTFFFKEVENGKTEIGVSSLNSHLSKFLAENLFYYLQNPGAETLIPRPVRKDRSYERRKGTQ
jgi:hypothetical protein